MNKPYKISINNNKKNKNSILNRYQAKRNNNHIYNLKIIAIIIIEYKKNNYLRMNHKVKNYKNQFNNKFTMKMILFKKINLNKNII